MNTPQYKELKELLVLIPVLQSLAQDVWPDDGENSYWKMYLQRMVVADDPIQYLGEHI